MSHRKSRTISCFALVVASAPVFGCALSSEPFRADEAADGQDPSVGIEQTVDGPEASGPKLGGGAALTTPAGLPDEDPPAGTPDPAVDPPEEGDSPEVLPVRPEPNADDVLDPRTLVASRGNVSGVDVAWSSIANAFGVVWVDTRDANREIYFATLDAEGDLVRGPVRLTDDPRNSHSPKIAENGGSFGITWVDEDRGFESVYFQTVSSEGHALTLPVAVSASITGVSSPSVSMEGPGWVVAWADSHYDDEEGGTEIMAQRLDERGLLLGLASRVSHNPGPSTSPEIVWGEDGFGLVWTEPSVGSSVGDQVHFGRLDRDLGVQYTEQLSHRTAVADHPTIHFDGRQFAIAWRQDGVDRDTVLFTARGLRGSTACLPQVVAGAPELLPAAPAISSTIYGWSLGHTLADAEEPTHQLGMTAVGFDCDILAAGHTFTGMPAGAVEGVEVAAGRSFSVALWVNGTSIKGDRF